MFKNGTENVNSVLTADDVLRLKTLREDRPRRWTQVALAEEFGISQGTVSKILSGRLWPQVRVPSKAIRSFDSLLSMLEETDE
jgi:transcriptional regulator with XRE-family HTH domain